MTINGDERAAAAWERIEAKLDRVGETLDHHGEILAQHSGILARHGELLAEHGRALALLDRRLARVEGDLDPVKLLIEGVRHEVDRKLDRLKDELLAALGRETRVELLAAQGLNEERLGELERRVLALEGRA